MQVRRLAAYAIIGTVRPSPTGVFACVLPGARRATGELLRTVVQHRGVWGETDKVLRWW